MTFKNLFLFGFSIWSFAAVAQVPQKVIVEHFTNSRCSSCASRNPGFFNNFNSSNTGDMIHLAIHPSSPYSSCIFSQHNKVQNDDRTRFYGIFGSTPRLVINGNPVSASTSYNSPSLFTPYKGNTTPISVGLSQSYKGLDSVNVRVVVSVVAAHNLGMQNLYVVLAEDTIFYNAPNGEDEHYNVFRTSLFGSTGMSISLPANVGDSVVYESTVAINSDWMEERIFALAILQNDADKSVTQTEALDALGPNPNITSVRDVNVISNVSVYPNPMTRVLRLEVAESGMNEYRLWSISGKQIRVGSFENTVKLNTEELPSGIYFITVSNTQGVFTQKIVKTE